MQNIARDMTFDITRHKRIFHHITSLKVPQYSIAAFPPAQLTESHCREIDRIRRKKLQAQGATALLLTALRQVQQS